MKYIEYFLKNWNHWKIYNFSYKLKEQGADNILNRYSKIKINISKPLFYKSQIFQIYNS